MKRLFVLLLGVFYLIVLANAQEVEPRPNFSGTWVLDKERSGLDSSGGQLRPSFDPEFPNMLIIEHQEPVLKMKRIFTSSGKEEIKEITYTTAEEADKKSGILKARWKRGKLETSHRETIRAGLVVDVMTVESLRLLEDGKTLVIETRIHTRSGAGRTGELSLKQVFTKWGEER